MTRQPAEEKRITVAWPMPRLAPVRSSVRRGALVDGCMNGSLSLFVPGHSSLLLRRLRILVCAAGHPRLAVVVERKTWMAGTSPAMTAYFRDTAALWSRAGFSPGPARRGGIRCG